MKYVLRVLLCLAVLLPALAQAYTYFPGSADPVPTETMLVPALVTPALDLGAIETEDAARELAGLAPRYALPHAVAISPSGSGEWEELGEALRVWRLRVFAPGALSLNFGFTGFSLPEGARLLVYSTDGSERIDHAFTSADNEDHGELWTPVILTDDAIIELVVPTKALDEFQLEMGSVGLGYRTFGELLSDRSGSCNNDVVCPEGDPWRDEIASVGVISTGGSLFCTGFMVNNTSADQTPYFMTANHCGVTSGNASSLVVYWNYESPNCGQQGGGPLSMWQSGSWWRSSYSSSDFTLVELDDAPNPNHEVSFAGWSNSSATPTSGTAIHHPSTDEKSISFEYASCPTTSYLSNSSPGDGTHIRVIDWDDGTTEPGSSGSPLFDQNHRVVGQLHGGYAACGNNSSDWYGRFSRSWTGGGSSSNRLSNWLDAAGTGQSTVNTLVPWAVGMAVSPSDGLTSSGDTGGPFTPSSKTYTITNQGDTGFSYTVSESASWLSLNDTGGYLSAGSSATVVVSINSGANSLPAGGYSDTVVFTNTTNHEGDTTRPVSLQVGVPSAVYSWDMNSNPGWTTSGQWAWGQPTGNGGDHGYPDPTSGHTGSMVYGYNLNGDYANNLSERHLTTTAIDCSDLSAVSLKFWRRLGVEQPAYDHAYLRVSNNGSSWTTLWENTAEVTDNSWVQYEYDISSIADGENAVYVRWTMGSTDGSWTYCGWNIDDVEIWGIGTDETAVGDPAAPARTVLLPNVPNPFNPRTRLTFDLATGGDVRLEIFDLSGRRQALLHAGHLDAGRHSFTWNGDTQAAQAASSGIYLARLNTPEGSEARKITLIK